MTRPTPRPALPAKLNKLAAPVARVDRLRVLEQMQRVVLRFADQIGGSPAEAERAFRSARLRVRREPYCAQESGEAEQLMPYLLLFEAWFQERQYVGIDGKPRALPLTGARSFATLVKRFVPRSAARSVADLLLSLGALREHGEGLLLPTGRTLLMPHLTATSLDRVPLALDRLLGTFAHNFQNRSPTGANPALRAQRRRRHARLERAAFISKLPIEDVPAFDDMIKTLAAAFLSQTDLWLQRRERAAPGASGRRRSGKTVAAGVSVFAFAGDEAAVARRAARGRPA